MKETVIRNWSDLQNAIFEDVWDPAIMRYRANFVYRGMSKASWSLFPSLNRACSHDLKLEKQLLRSLKKYGYADLQGVTSFWQTAALAQQFGLPTRLLDWTYSPLVAAHFATEDVGMYDRDGVIWCADIDRINEALPRALRERLKERQTGIFTMDMLDRIGSGYDALTAFSMISSAIFRRVA